VIIIATRKIISTTHIQNPPKDKKHQPMQRRSSNRTMVKKTRGEKVNKPRKHKDFKNKPKKWE
jgi:hypothetical protein